MCLRGRRGRHGGCHRAGPLPRHRDPRARRHPLPQGRAQGHRRHLGGRLRHRRAPGRLPRRGRAGPRVPGALAVPRVAHGLRLDARRAALPAARDVPVRRAHPHLRVPALQAHAVAPPPQPQDRARAGNRGGRLHLQLAAADRVPAAGVGPRAAPLHVRVLPPAGDELHAVQPAAVWVAQLALPEGDPHHLLLPATQQGRILQAALQSMPSPARARFGQGAGGAAGPGRSAARLLPDVLEVRGRRGAGWRAGPGPRWPGSRRPSALPPAASAGRAAGPARLAHLPHLPHRTALDHPAHPPVRRRDHHHHVSPGHHLRALCKHFVISTTLTLTFQTVDNQSFAFKRVGCSL